MKATKFSDVQKAFFSSRAPTACCGDLPQGRYHPGDLFQLEDQV